MADFAAAVDPNPDRLAGFLDRARESVGPVDGLVPGELVSGPFAVVWEAAGVATVGVHRDPRSAAVLWGDAVAPGDDEPLDPERFTALVDANAPVTEWRAPDGFHASVAFGAPARLAASGDLLGLFPIYHWSSADGVVVVASSPAHIECHPSFRAASSPEGLAGVLLTGGPVEGRTLWAGVRRLPAGHVALFRDGAVEEVRVYETPYGSDEPLEDVDVPEALHEALLGAVRRTARTGRSTGLLLSGGRDSRLIAGALDEIGAPFEACTLGRAGDFEADCARAAARAIGVDHFVDEVPGSRFEDHARTHARVEHVMGNASGLYNWGVGDLLRAGAIVTGHDLELACGGVHLDRAGAEGSSDPGWEGLRESVSLHALDLDTLERLVRDPTLRQALRDVDGRIRELFDGYGKGGAVRARGFIWNHWARFHPGAIPWRLSFRAWPVLPVLDRRLLDVGSRISSAMAGDRRAQDAVLARFYPRLARAPLLRSSGDLDPLVKAVGWRAGQIVDRWKPGGGSRPPEQRRYYQRMYDLDGDGWRGVRRAAEPSRRLLHDLFHEAELRALLPGPEATMGLARPIADGYGRKTLLALMLWHGRR